MLSLPLGWGARYTVARYTVAMQTGLHEKNSAVLAFFRFMCVCYTEAFSDVTNNGSLGTQVPAGSESSITLLRRCKLCWVHVTCLVNWFTTTEKDVKIEGPTFASLQYGVAYYC
jgi:hypothetical protein